MQLGLPEEWEAAFKRSTSSDFLAFELKAIPLSLNTSFKTATVIFPAGPCFIRSFFHVFTFLSLPRVSFPGVKVVRGVLRFKQVFRYQGEECYLPDGVSGIFWMN